ncbi:DSBA-like thioredoxin domain protein [compost metagenome]
MWEREKKMDDPAVILAVLEESGLDGARILARIDEPAVKAKLLENTQNAFERGAFGSPTFFVNDEIYFGKDRLQEVEEEIGRVIAAGRPA